MSKDITGTAAANPRLPILFDVTGVKATPAAARVLAGAGMTAEALVERLRRLDLEGNSLNCVSEMYCNLRHGDEVLAAWLVNGVAISTSAAPGAGALVETEEEYCDRSEREYQAERATAKGVPMRGRRRDEEAGA